MPIPDKIQTGINPHKGVLPINIYPDIAKKINSLAVKRKVKAENLINEILDQYLSRQMPKRESGTAFLLSLAGMFDSGKNDTSENVNRVVKDFIF